MRSDLKVLSVALSFVLAAPSAYSGEADQSAARTVIQNQIEAFKGGRDAEAYSYAAPTIKGYFPDVSTFMDMVKRGYPQVYAPQSYDFGRVKEAADGTIAQELNVIGPDGKSWKALYSLKRQSDGSWKINAVQLIPGNDQAV